MKKQLPFTLSSLMSFTFCTLIMVTASAQPSLQSADLHTGLSFDVYSLSNVNSTNLMATGANVTWDLSAATMGALAARVDFVDMASTGYAAQYPTADFAMKFTIGGASHYNFWRTTSAVWEEVAINVGNGGLQTFINNRTDLVFPYTFNTATVDTYQKAGQSSNTVSHTYDAYGTLTLSTGSISNLVHDNSTDNGVGATQVIWWQASPIAPVLQADNTGVSLWKQHSATGINPVKGELSFQVYPNPASSELHILNEKPLEKIELYDITGQLQLTSNRSVIDINSLSKGIYIIKAFTANGIETAKFMKQ